MIKRLIIGLYMLVILAGLIVPVPQVVKGQDTVTYEEVMRLGEGTINAVSWRPDGQMIAVGTSLGLVLYSTQLEKITQLSEQRVETLFWHPGGKEIAMLGPDGVTIQDAATGYVIRRMPEEIGLGGWNADGSLFATVNLEAIHIWDSGLNEVLSSFNPYVEPSNLDCQVHNCLSIYRGALTWHPNGIYIAFHWPYYDYGVTTWNALSGEMVFPAVSFGEEAPPVWSPDGTQLVVFEAYGWIEIWEASSDERLMVIEVLDDESGSHYVWTPDWNADGSLLAYGTSGAIYVWDTRVNELNTVFRFEGSGHGDGGRRQVAWSPDDSRLLTSTPNSLQIVNVQTGEVLAAQEVYTGEVNAVAWSSDGTRVAAGYGGWEVMGDNQVRIWDAAQGGRLAGLCEGHIGAVLSVAWSPDDTKLASAAGGWYAPDGSIRIWDSATCTFLYRDAIDIPFAETVMWSADGNHVFANIGDSAFVLDNTLASYTLLVNDKGRSPVRGAIWSPDETKVAGYGTGGSVRLFDAARGGILHILEGHSYEDYPVGLDIMVEKMAWSPDSSRIASSGDGNTVRVWDAETGEPLLLLYGHEGRVMSVAWSPDGSQLASASADHTIRIWDANDGSLMSVLEGHTDWVFAVAWSPDGRQLASSGLDGTVRIWEQSK